jgi:hypothetical protein
VLLVAVVVAVGHQILLVDLVDVVAEVVVHHLVLVRQITVELQVVIQHHHQ